MRFRLRTLLIALAVLPPLLAPIMVWGWREYVIWRNRQSDSLILGDRYLGGIFDDVGGRGVEVLEVRSGYAAEAGGLLAGDVITAINNQPCRDLVDFDSALSQATIGTTLKMDVNRGGTLKRLRVTLGKRPVPQISSSPVPQMPVQPAPPRIADQRQPSSESIH